MIVFDSSITICALSGRFSLLRVFHFVRSRVMIYELVQ